MCHATIFWVLGWKVASLNLNPVWQNRSGFTQSFLSVRGVRTRDEPLRTFAWEATSIRDPPNPKEKSARAFKEGIYFTPTSIYTAILLFFSDENHFSSSWTIRNMKHEKAGIWFSQNMFIWNGYYRQNRRLIIIYFLGIWPCKWKFELQSQSWFPVTLPWVPEDIFFLLTRLQYR